MMRNLLIAIVLCASACAARPVARPVGRAEVDLARTLEARYSAPATNVKSGEPGPEDVIPNEYVISYHPGQEAEARQYVADRGGTVLRLSRTGGDFLVARIPNSAIHIPQSAVLTVEPNLVMRAAYEPNDPFYLTQQWDRWVMYSDRAWDYSRGARDVKVCIVDEGVDYTHPDLAANFDGGLLGYDFVSNDNDPRPMADSESHATHVAGIVGAVINNSSGVAGWTQAMLYSCRVLNEAGSGSLDAVADGIRWGADHGARVINLSLGSYGGSSTLELAVNYAWDHNALVIGAAGNDNTRGVFLPGAYARAIAVGATDEYSQRASFSNYGSELDLAAPGSSILSTLPSNMYGFMSGTSMATPEVSGVAALILSNRPELSNSAVRAILEASAIDMGTSGRDEYFGYGLVNAWRALQLAEMYGTDEEVITPVPGASRTGPAGLYDMQGRRIRTGATTGALTPSQPGVYFLRTPGAAPRKVVVF